MKENEPAGQVITNDYRNDDNRSDHLFSVLIHDKLILTLVIHYLYLMIPSHPARLPLAARTRTLTISRQGGLNRVEPAVLQRSRASEPIYDAYTGCIKKYILTMVKLFTTLQIESISSYNNRHPAPDSSARCSCTRPQTGFIRTVACAFAESYNYT